MMENTPYELETKIIGPLPIINHFLNRLKIDDILSRNLIPTNSQQVDPATCIGVLLRNLILERKPIYSINEWANHYCPNLLGLNEKQVPHLNDDRIGRALDNLYDTDRASLQTEIVVRAITEFHLNTDELHNDSTTLTFSGEYENANGENKRGKESVAITYGHNKDHRPDLKQILWIFTVTADGAVPMHYRVCDGNTTDSPTHIDTWNALKKLLPNSNFLYVADCKLCTTKNLTYIASHDGSFITVIPRSDGDDSWFRKYLQSNKVSWIDIDIGSDNEDSEYKDRWKAVESPMRSSNGFRIIWFWHSQKEERDQLTRRKLIEKAVDKFGKLERRLCKPRNRLRSKDAIVKVADEIIDGPVKRWIEYKISEEKIDSYRQEKRGRPGTQTTYKRMTNISYHVSWHLRQINIDYDAKSDGMFPLITNCNDMPMEDVLRKYKYQPKLEKRHQQLKTVYDITPMFLKSVTRIEGLLFVYFIAMLVQALIEREIRSQMEQRKIQGLPIYPENRRCVSPTTDMVLSHFDHIQIHHLLANEEIVQTFLTPISEKQQQLLELMNVPIKSYL